MATFFETINAVVVMRVHCNNLPSTHFCHRVLARILKIGVKCCRPEKVGVLPYFSIETFQKVGVRNEKLE